MNELNIFALLLTVRFRTIVLSLMLYSILGAACSVTKFERTDLGKLEDAAGKGDITVVQEELTKTFDPNLLIPKDKEFVKDCTFVDFAPLHLAAFKGHNEVVRLLIDRGINVNLCIHPRRQSTTGDKYIGYTFQTPLISSIMGSRIETIKVLIEKGADVNRSIEYSVTNRMPPLTVACARGELEIVKLLIQSGAKVNPEGMASYDENRPLAAAIWVSGNAEIAKLLLQNGAEANFMDYTKAKERGLTEVAYLIQKANKGMRY